MSNLRNIFVTVCLTGFLIGMPFWYFYKALGSVGLLNAVDTHKFSEVMGRNLTPFEKPNLGNFLSGVFQSNLEAVSCDRLPAYSLIVKAYRDVSRRFSTLFLIVLPRSWSPVLPVGGRIISPWDLSRLSTLPTIYLEKHRNRLIERGKYYNRLAIQNPSCHFYVFPVLFVGDWLSESPKYFKGKTNVLSGERLVTEFRHLLESKISYSWIGEGLSPDSAMELYYKTDHHLSNKGSLYAYYQIVKKLQAHNKLVSGPLTNQRSIASHNILFRGSHSRRAGAFEKIADEFKDAEFNLPKLTIETSRYETSRGQKEKYFTNSAPVGKFFNHYAHYYGGDRGMVQYRCNSAPKRNLLVISDSFDNPIESLLAVHYRSSFYIDLRFYNKEIGRPFEIDDFISKNKIDDVIFFGNRSWIIGLTEIGLN